MFAIIKSLCFVCIVSAFLAMLSLSVQAQNLNDIENQDAETGLDIGNISIPGEKCEQWAEDQGITTAEENENDDGSTFYASVGASDISAPTGHDNWILSRRNAYTKAMLAAKAELARTLGLDIGREIFQDIAENAELFSKEDASVEQQKDTNNNERGTQFEDGKVKRTDSRGASSAYHKVLELVNRSLDKELKGSEPQKLSDDPQEAMEQVKEKVLDTVGEEVFSDATQSAAQHELVGLRRIFIHESAPLGKKGQICIVAIHSPKTRQIAAGMGMRDASLLPKTEPGEGKPLKQLAPSCRTKAGKKKLISSFGIDVRTDDRGNSVVIAYGQSKARSAKPRHLKIGHISARNNAFAEMRSFVGEVVVTKSKEEASESLKELADQSEDYEGGQKIQDQIKSVSEKLNIQGVKRMCNWAAYHPATKQVVAGTVMYFSSKSLKGAQKTKADMKSTHDRIKSGNKGSRGSGDGSGRTRQQRGYEQSVGGGRRKKDF
ncbi:MAG: hypothetical protein CMF71_09505 [Magnetovibrio sp.]|nr:hypothetical protein [Magnetovibrio sp.]